MSPEQRREARETFQGLRRLPPAQQHELRERWLRSHQGEESSGSEPNFDRPRQPSPGPTRPDYSREQRPAPSPR